MLIMVAQNVQRESPSLGMAMTSKPKPIDILLQGIRPPVSFVDYRVLVTRRFLLVLQFIPRLPKDCFNKYAPKWKEVLKTIKTNYL